MALAALRLKTLTRGGALGAAAIGTCTFGALGWPGAAVLFAFFVPAVALSRFGRVSKGALRDVGKHGARDGSQVLANGAIAAACALAALVHALPFAAAFAGAFAAAAADTWGTEIGTLARSRPRSLRTFRPIATGLSGGVTWLGTLAQCAGGTVVAAVAAITGVAGFVPVAAGGIAGALADSALGATLQELRYCGICERACETDPHACGSATRRVRGIPGLGNDAVNVLSTLTGAVVAVAFAIGLRP